MIQTIKIVLSLLVSIAITAGLIATPFGQVIYLTYLIIFAIYIIMGKKQYYHKNTWLLATAINPIATSIVYLFVGQEYKTRSLLKMKEAQTQTFEKYTLQADSTKNDDEVINTLKSIGKSNLYTNNRTKLLANGEEKFTYLLKYLQAAQKHIHMQYYIFVDSEIADQVYEILKVKVLEGVEVKVLIDDIGSKKLSKKFKNKLRQANIEMVKFAPTRIFTTNQYINFRNHRKIVVIDNLYGFVGGINVADRYINAGKKLTWKDAHLFIEGPAVSELQMTFCKDWYHETKENLLLSSKVEYIPKINSNQTEGYVQIINSGPDSDHDYFKDLIFKLIATAKEEILITTPYLIPSYDLIIALRTSAQVGVKVRIITPGQPDNKVIFQATQSYYETLMEAGVEIYETKGFFLHSKLIVIDNKTALIGTINLDQRSLFVNFETTAILYETQTVSDIRTFICEDISPANKIDYQEWKKRSIFKKIYEQTMQLFSSLL